jgi:hypothetical protein
VYGIVPYTIELIGEGAGSGVFCQNLGYMRWN